MEMAVQMYGLAYRSAAGQGARDYAERRGLSPETLKRFEIGFAPDSRNHQAQHFRDKGLTEEAVEAGLLIRPEGGGTPYDRFRNRLMFPIRDPRGRCIAFGGRALDPNAQAKCLNSPETELFHKGRTLYNHGPAREAAGKAGTLIVAEGYMDVIAPAAAGFGNAVAPLGTAITEEQLQFIWRIAEEPIIALDGDEAGLRAAERLIDLALPMLAPGRSLRFCLMPEGRDPDDHEARPLIEMLWLRETSAAPLDTPERRAALDRRLREALRRIGDESVRNHYAADIKARRAELFRPAAQAPFRPQGQGGGRKGGRPGKGAFPAYALPETRQSDLARKGQSGQPAEARIREGGILLIACHNPQALEPVEHLLEEMTLRTPEFSELRDALLAALAEGADVREAILARTGKDPFETLERVPQARAHPLAKPGRRPERVAEVLTEAIGRHQASLAFEAEIAEAARDLGDAEGEDWTWRVRQAGHLLQEADRRAIAAADEPEADAVSGIRRMLDAEVYKTKKR
jgi:DNA primase